MKRVTLLALFLALGPATLAAQQAIDSRWLPWLGCWQAGEGTESETEGPLVCVRPSADPFGVEIATVVNGEIASSRTLVADGQPHDVAIEDCSGSQFAEFSADGRRVYLWSTMNCEGGRKRTASAIMAMATASEWLDAQSLGMNGERVPRVLRYHPAPVSSWPDEFQLSGERAMAVDDARALAARELSLAAVREAASHVDHEALAAFLLERGQEFDLTAEKLAQLADAGVPGDVIDALVAASYPTRFAIDRDALRMALKPGEPRERTGIAYDPFGWGRWGYGSCYTGPFGWGYPGWSSYCSPFYWSSAYGFGGFWPYYYDPYWYGGGYWGRPIIVVRDGTESAPGGALVRGRGYTRGGTGGGTGRYAQPRGGSATQGRSGGSRSPSVSSPSSSSGGRGSASPGGYTRGGSSSSRGSSGTAKPKCCS